MLQIGDSIFFMKLSVNGNTGYVRSKLFMRVRGVLYLKMLQKDLPAHIKSQIGLMKYEYALDRFRARFYD